ncbi:MAG: ArnT family glycosyltransferase, partial [Anaerolineales bacterium]
MDSPRASREASQSPSLRPGMPRESGQTRLYLAAGAVLLLGHLALAAASARLMSLTYDEPNHLRYGEQILVGDSDRFDDSKMPFSALNAGVVRLGRALLPSLFQGTWQPERIGRLATILFSTFIASVIWLWATAWYGRLAGLAALFLYALEPNTLAHAGLITTDVYAAGMIALSVLSFRWFLANPTLGRAAGCGLIVGLAQLAKYTSVFVYLILFILGMVHLSRRPIRLSFPRARTWALLAAAFLLANLLVINAGFLFRRSFVPFGQYRFRSDLFRTLQSSLPTLNGLPVPLPYPYFEGLDWVRQRDQSGKGYGSRYLFGEARDDRGFAGYYVFAYLFKVPLPGILALSLALIGYLR